MMIGYTRNGVPVFDRHSSHLHCSVDDVRLALQHVQLEGEFVKVTHTFDPHGPLGLCECVVTGPEDNIVYIQRPKRWGKTRFVLDRKPVLTSSLSMILMLKPEGYVLLTAFWGTLAEPEPWDDRAFHRDSRGYDAARKASIEFWSNHALVLTSGC
jgi:hypothetical protein